MSREVHVRFCERLGHLSPADSTDDINSSEVCGVAGGGYIEGKSAIHLARVYMGKKRNFVGQSFWARGYYVSTVGRDEQVVREYIRNQEAEERRLDQLDLLR